eukprot:scaffold330_cov109-Isochrysis_galbana.AAC.4
MGMYGCAARVQWAVWAVWAPAPEWPVFIGCRCAPPSLKHHLAWASADRATAIISSAPRLRFQLVHP